MQRYVIDIIVDKPLIVTSLCCDGTHFVQGRCGESGMDFWWKVHLVVELCKVPVGSPQAATRRALACKGVTGGLWHRLQGVHP